MDCQEIRADLRATAASYSAQRQQSAQLPTAKDVRSPQSLSVNVWRGSPSGISKSL